MKKAVKRENASEVEFVQGSSKNAINKSAASHGAAIYGDHDSDMKHEPIDDEDNVSFGQPSTLLRPANTLQPLESVSRPDAFDEDDDPSSWSFGVPVSLLCDSTLLKMQPDVFTEEPSNTRAGPSRPSANPIQGGASSSLSHYKDSSVPPSAMDIDDDEWGMGDDEMALIDPEADEEEEEEMDDINSPVEFSESDVTVCPICALRLVGLFVTVSNTVISLPGSNRPTILSLFTGGPGSCQ